MKQVSNKVQDVSKIIGKQISNKLKSKEERPKSFTKRINGLRKVLVDFANKELKENGIYSEYISDVELIITMKFKVEKGLFSK